MNWRRSEWMISFATVVTIAGWIWVASSKNSQLEQTREEVIDLRPKVDQNQKDIIELRAINTTQMSMIIRELDSLHREMKHNNQSGITYQSKDVVLKD